MATFYLDAENGNDANDGTTFANRWKTITNGATEARIAPGDTIRIMASPDPTSIGSATWTGGGRPASINISSSTNATPIVITTASAHGLVANDYVVVASHTINTNANGVWKVGTVASSTQFEILQIDGSNTTGNGVGGATGNITKANNLVVKTSSALIKNIALFGGLGQKPAWTASANVTATQSETTGKEGYSAASIAVAAGFTTGKAAYYTLPSTLDLSAYQQVSFWIRQTAGNIGAAGSAYLALCSDTTGDTVVHQCDIPTMVATNSPFQPVTINFNTNLNSSIQSVAFYIVTDDGAQTFLIDNIIACKAASSDDSITLQSLISKSDGTGNEAWYNIQSINNDVIMLGNANAFAAVDIFIRGYSGESETVTTYKRETIKIPPVSPFLNVNVINDSGTSGNLITFSGGWNRTDMSTQTGVTWWDGLNGGGTFITVSSAKEYIKITKLNACRFGLVYSLSSVDYITLDDIYATANSSTLLTVGGLNRISELQNKIIFNNNTAASGASLSGRITSSGTIYNLNNGNMSISAIYSVFENIEFKNNNLSFSLTGSYITVKSLVSEYNSSASGVNFNGGPGNIVLGGSSTGNSTAGAAVSGNRVGYLSNFTINESTETSISTPGYLYSSRHDNTDGNNWVFQASGTVNQQTSVIDSPATTAWKMSPTLSGNNSQLPVQLKIATIVVGATGLVTVTARMRRDDTGLTMRLLAPANGMTLTTEVYTDMTAAANTWETVTLTFTPTRAGGADIYVYAFGGTTYNGYVSNITASQA